MAPVWVSSDTSAASIPAALAGSWLRAAAALQLHRRVERGVDPQPAPVQLVVALLERGAEDVGALQQVLTQRLGVVARRHLLGGQRADALWQHELATLRARLGAADVAVVDQAAEHLREPVPAALGVVDRVIGRGRPHQPGQERRLDERQLVHVLGEVGLGSGLDAVGVVPEEHRVQVALEDLGLRELLLQHLGVVDLQQLVAPVTIEARQVLVLHHLHGDRGCPLLGGVGGEVGQRRPHQAAQVHAVVLVELVVLHGEEGGDHLLGHPRQLDRLAVLQLVDVDQVAGAVVGEGPPRQRLEVRQRDRLLFMGVRHLPQPGRHRDHQARHQQRTGGERQGEAEDPGQRMHRRLRLVPPGRPEPAGLATRVTEGHRSTRRTPPLWSAPVGGPERAAARAAVTLAPWPPRQNVRSGSACSSPAPGPTATSPPWPGRSSSTATTWRRSPTTSATSWRRCRR